jgi:hypothetical protein
MTDRSLRSTIGCLSASALVSLSACSLEPEGNDSLFLDTGFETNPGDGDGDGETGDPGDGDPGDGDGDSGDGDGDPGDGDGDTGDGDGDTGDGDGDSGDGDGDTSSCVAPDPGWGGVAQVGQPAPHFSGINQAGEQVSICEYEGLPIVIDTSAVWCGPCQMLSSCLGGDNNSCISLFTDPAVVDYLVLPLREEIAAGTFAWVTVLTENVNGGPPSANDAQVWDQTYPVYNVWVIPDVTQQYYGHLSIMAFPSVWLINAQMNWQDLDQMSVFGTIISYL